MLQDMVHRIRHKFSGKASFPEWSVFSREEDRYLSAVLVPLIAVGKEVKVLFIQRPSFMKRHAGQIAFPGGVMEVSDAGPLETSLRETREELGLESEIIEPLYLMPPERAVTSGFIVYPVVALVHISPDRESVKPDHNEVQDYFFIDPFDLPFDPVEKSFLHEGRIHTYTEFPMKIRKSIWGVTGRIFNALIRDLAVLREPS